LKTSVVEGSDSLIFGSGLHGKNDTDLLMFYLNGCLGYSLSSNQFPINAFLLYPSQICCTYAIR